MIRVLSSALAFTVLALSGPTAHAAPNSAVPDLTGEAFVASAIPARGTSQATGTCTPFGQSMYTFHVTGEAIGPYSGTFVEDGTFTLGPITGLALVSFDATFTITSDAGTVTGTKTLAPDVGPVNVGVCGIFTGFVPNAPDSFDLQAPARYTAQLDTPSGRASDSGETVVSYQDMQVRDVPNINTFNFTENFTSDAFLAAQGQKTTGGGRIAPDVSFGFVAMRNNLQGNCSVDDHTLDVHVKCLDVTSYGQFGNQATFTGHAAVDGVATTYRIHVEDGGEPGAGVDTFTIQTQNGYSASGPLTAGNVQVKG
ncbi:MAG: post-COAP-1 domain-containing protein [Gaiellaceae bacterium]